MIPKVKFRDLLVFMLFVCPRIPHLLTVQQLPCPTIEVFFNSLNEAICHNQPGTKMITSLQAYKLTTHFASNAKAHIAAAEGADTEVPVNPDVQVPRKSVVV